MYFGTVFFRSTTAAESVAVTARLVPDPSTFAPE